MMVSAEELKSTDVRRRFDRFAPVFDNADFVHQVTRDGLLDRMAPLTIEPRVILDVGCATGAGSRLLAKRFRKSSVISVDLSLGMLRKARAGRSRFSRVRELQAEANRLPVPDQSIDIVFANLLLPWIDDFGTCFTEIARVLSEDGVFVFSSLGPDSFSALREAWAATDGGHHVRSFPDMHDIGDALVQNGLIEPVLDVDRLTITYDDSSALMKDLAMSGSGNCLSGRRSTVTGRRRFEAMLNRLGDGRVALELEIVFGHAWGRGARPPAGEFHIEPGAIGRFGRS